LKLPEAHRAQQESWDRIADGWSEWVHHNDARKWVLDPAHLAMLGDISGKRVLDAGCGEGRFARMMADRGSLVTAIDLSSKMIEIASGIESAEPRGIDYREMDMADLSPLSDDSFDLAIAYVSLVDVPEYERAIAEIARVMRNGGRFTFSIVHPCFAPPGSTWEPRLAGRIPVRNKDKLFKKIDNYFPASEVRFRMWPTAPAETVNFHRPLCDYAHACRDAGLLIRDIVEPTPSEEVARERDYLREHFRAPFFIIFDCLKAGA